MAITPAIALLGALAAFVCAIVVFIVIAVRTSRAERQAALQEEVHRIVTEPVVTAPIDIDLAGLEAAFDGAAPTQALLDPLGEPGWAPVDEPLDAVELSGASLTARFDIPESEVVAPPRETVEVTEAARRAHWELPAWAADLPDVEVPTTPSPEVSASRVAVDTPDEADELELHLRELTAQATSVTVASAPEPEVRPEPAPLSEPQLEPQLQPKPEPQPEQVPEQELEPQPEPLPQPEPAAQSEPQPQPLPQPLPGPLPEPEPSPLPEPAVAPAPAPIWELPEVPVVAATTGAVVSALAFSEQRPVAAVAERNRPYTVSVNGIAAADSVLDAEVPHHEHAEADIPELTLAAPVEMWFGDHRVGVRVGTATYDRFMRYADVLIQDLNASRPTGR